MARKSSFTSTRARIKMRRLLQETDAGIKPAMQDSVNTLLKDVQSRVPHDTGNLSNNITGFVAKNGLRGEVGLRGKKARKLAFYAKFIEFGAKTRDGRDMPARPFLEPAWDFEKPRIINRVNKVIKDAIKKAQR